jgi:hypothetical protein
MFSKNALTAKPPNYQTDKPGRGKPGRAEKGLTGGGGRGRVKTMFGTGWRMPGRDGRQDIFIPLHLSAKLSLLGNLRNFHDRRRALSGAL